MTGWSNPWLAAKRLFHQATIGDQNYRFLFRPGPPDEVVAIDCETTGLDVAHDEIITIAAIRIRGSRILASERFEALVRPDVRIAPEAIKVHHLLESEAKAGALIYHVLPDLLRFIGGRPLVGYYLEFDIAMLNKAVLGFIGVELPNKRIEVSRLYHERKYGDAPPGTVVDLSFAAMLADLGIPRLSQHDAVNDALMTAMAYVALRDLKRRGARIPRPRMKAPLQPGGV
ncbi:3'-5' exonuclease [Alsobacter metallidurans]|uniref:3'-5' exonuclease n=1 Tax=Alsobacter metallidurans TaxID=340221 RepID=A0A917IAE9_9HYPH|nr:3'-5' exonuclease [Alsobacter metallidurans]GGH25634.1 3'-5' exonuclease [Alsobacter metallidurans]